MREDWEIWNEVLNRATTGGVHSLNDKEQAVYLVNGFLTDFENSGLSGLLYNLSPSEGHRSDDWSELRATAAALRSVGAMGAADEILNLAKTLESIESSVGNLGDFLSQVSPGLLSSVEASLASTAPDIWELLSSYTQAQRASLVHA